MSHLSWLIFVSFFIFLMLDPVQSRSGESVNIPKPQPLKSAVEAGMLALYEFRLEDSDSIAKDTRLRFPDKAESYVYYSYCLWWNIISGSGSNINRADFINNVNKALEIQLWKVSQPTCKYEDQFLYIVAAGLKVRYDMLFGNYLSAIRDLNQCLSVLKSTFGNENNFEPFYLTSGLYNCSVGSLRNSNPALIPLTVFLPVANFERGLAYLVKSAGSMNLFTRIESTYFLTKINFENGSRGYDVGIRYCSSLTNKFPDNLIFQKILLDYYNKIGKSDEVENVKLKIRSSAKRNPQLSQRQKEYFFTIVEKY